jgi:hypothetical protein
MRQRLFVTFMRIFYTPSGSDTFDDVSETRPNEGPTFANDKQGSIWLFSFFPIDYPTLPTFGATLVP